MDSRSAAQDLAHIVNIDEEWSVTEGIEAIRDIASFTMTNSDGEDFTVAVTRKDGK